MGYPKFIEERTKKNIAFPIKELLRPDEVADFFNVSKRTIYNWCESGLFQTCKIKQTIRIYRSSVIEYLKNSNPT